MGCPVITGPGTAVNLVQEGWDTWNEEAQNAVAVTGQYLNALSDLSVTPVPVTVNFDLASSLSAPFAKPEAPTAPDLTFDVSERPSAPALGDISVPVIQSLVAALPTEPVLSLPDAPAALGMEAPTNVPVLPDRSVPSAPTLVLPDDPSLIDIVLPASPSIQLPTFTAVAPSAGWIDSPDDSFSFVEELYTSYNLETLKTRVGEMLADGVGLPDAVWDAIWERGGEQESAESMRAIQAVTQEWASRGFTLPQGAQAARVDSIRQEALKASHTRSRELVIQRAQMEVENAKFAVVQAIALEDSLHTAHLQRQARALQVQQAAADLGVAVFNGRVALFNAMVSSFNAQAEAYRAELQGEIQKLEAYRIEMEGRRIQSELNRQAVEQYNQQLQALNTRVDLYRTQVQAVQTLVDTDKSKLDAFRTQVEAFGEAVRAKTAEFQGYGEAIKGEMAKASVYDTQVRAYASRVDAWKTEIEGKQIKSRIETDIERLKLDSFTAQLQAFSEEVRAEAARVNAGSTVFDGLARLYGAELAAESARVASEDKQFALALERADKEYNLAMKQADLNIQQTLRVAALEQENLKTVATVQSSLAASALSAVNLSASVGSNDSWSKSCSETYNY